MIISLDESPTNQKAKHDATVDFQMFSRSGKSTTNMYLAFQQSAKKAQESANPTISRTTKKSMNRTDDYDSMANSNLNPSFGLDDQFDHMLGEKRPQNLQQILMALQEQEKVKAAKQKAERRSDLIVKDSTGQVRENFRPIDLLQNVKFRRTVQSCFKSTTRDGWQQAHSSKTNPPDVGKYKPKYDFVQPDVKEAAVSKEHSNIGALRKEAREDQQMQVCLRAVKGLNHGLNHEKSQARRNAEIQERLDFQARQDAAVMANKHDQGQTGMNANPSESGNSPTNANNPNAAGNEGEEGEEQKNQQNPKKNQQSQGSVIFRQELREPNYTEVTHDLMSPKVKQPPGTNFRRSYISNGQQVQLKSLAEQNPLIQRFFIDDWKRKQYGYETYFEGEAYHLVKSKRYPGLEVHPNEPLKAKPQEKILLNRSFEGYSPRKKVENFLSPKRFDNIDKDPSIYSNVKRTQEVSFGSQLPRKHDLFGVPENPGTFYDVKKDKVMKRLDSGMCHLNRCSQKSLTHKVRKEEFMSCVDPQRVMQSTNHMLKTKAGMAVADLDKQKSRDELLYRTTESLANTLLENVKEEREGQMNARRKANRQLQLYITQQIPSVSQSQRM